MTGRRARGFAAALAVPIALLIVPGAPAHGADLPALVDEFIAQRMARAPVAARRAGFDETLALAPTVAAGTLSAERAWLAGFHVRLDALAAPAQARDPNGEWSAARTMLAAAVTHDSLELEVLRPFERDPCAYLPLVAGSVAAALDRANASRCAALRGAVRRLEEVPEVLRAARVNLRRPPRVLVERALERYAAVLRFYRTDVPRLAEDCRSPRMQADLAVADTLAVRAVQAFVAALAQDLPPAAAGDLAIGGEACRRLVASALGSEAAPVESLLAEARALVEARRAELDSLAGILGSDPRVALDSLAASEDEAPIVTARRAVERMQDFVRATDLVTVPPRLTVSVRPARPIDEPDAVALAGSAGGDPRTAPVWLAIAGADSIELPGPDADLVAGHWEQEIASFGEALPGRLLRELGGRGRNARLGLAAADIWPGGDWGQYCERMVIGMGYGARDPHYRLVLAARALRQAGRSFAALALAAGAMSPEEAQAMLADRCLLAPDAAGRAMRWAASEPACMGYTIGAQRLLELQDEAWRRLGPRFRTRLFNDAVLRCGVAPYGFVRARLWHELAVAAGNDPVGAKR